MCFFQMLKLLMIIPHFLYTEYVAVFFFHYSIDITFQRKSSEVFFNPINKLTFLHLASVPGIIRFLVKLDRIVSSMTARDDTLTEFFIMSLFPPDTMWMFKQHSVLSLQSSLNFH